MGDAGGGGGGGGDGDDLLMAPMVSGKYQNGGGWL